MALHSYPKVFNLGHRALAQLFSGPVDIEEKVDGSQFSAGVMCDGLGVPELFVRSRGKEIDLNAPEKMFAQAIETIMAIHHSLAPGWTYRFEYLKSPKHNTLCYQRIPRHHLILIDVDRGQEHYVDYDSKAAIAANLGLEVVPLLYSQKLFANDPIELLDGLFDIDSVLGDQKIEGVVIKPTARNLWGEDGKALMGKYVSPAFREKHQKVWRKENPTPTDIVDAIAQQFRSEARWEKTLQHLRDDGALEGSPRDIGDLMREVPIDIIKECKGEIQEELWKWAWPHIRRKVTAGLPEWYKAKLAESQPLGQ